jgi:hypothetical protein
MAADALPRSQPFSRTRRVRISTQPTIPARQITSKIENGIGLDARVSARCNWG